MLGFWSGASVVAAGTAQGVEFGKGWLGETGAGIGFGDGKGQASLREERRGLQEAGVTGLGFVALVARASAVKSCARHLWGRG